MPEHSKVTIVGGGTSGCAAAIFLALNNVSDVCIINQPVSRNRLGECVPPDTRLLLKKLELWEGFEMQAHLKCLGSRASWSQSILGYNDFFTNPYGFGWHLDRIRFDRLLEEKTKSLGINWIEGTCNQVTCSEGRFRVHCPDRTVESDWLIEASGPSSPVGRSLGAVREVVDQLIFAYVFFRHSSLAKEGNFTLLEAVENGWWYTADIPGKEAAVAFATDPEMVRVLQSGRRVGWLKQLLSTTYVAKTLEGATPISPGPVLRSVSPSLLSPAGGSNWLAVGDAAAVYDPLMAQGIYKGLSTGIKGAESIMKAIGGEQEAMTRFQSSMIDEFNSYQKARDYFYQQEQRWTKTPFWQRRVRRRKSVK